MDTRNNAVIVVVKPKEWLQIQNFVDKYFYWGPNITLEKNSCSHSKSFQIMLKDLNAQAISKHTTSS